MDLDNLRDPERVARLAVLLQTLSARIDTLRRAGSEEYGLPVETAPAGWFLFNTACDTDLSELSDSCRVVDEAIRQASELDFTDKDDLDFGTTDEDTWLP